MLPQRPQSALPPVEVGPPPQHSHRFLRHTLEKLSDDSARAGGGAGSVIAAARQQTSSDPVSPRSVITNLPTRPESVMTNLPSRALSPRRCDSAGEQGAQAEGQWLGTSRPLLIADLERWRQSFQAEASRCVEEIRSAVEGTDVAQIAAQFGQWHRTNTAEITRLRDHVDELLKLNVSLRQCTLDHLNDRSAEEFKTLRESILGMSGSVAELVKAHRQHHEQTLASIAESAAERVLVAWRADMQAQGDLWRRHCAEQREQWGRDEEHRGKVELGLDKLRERVGLLEDATERQGSKTRLGIETLQHQVTERVENRMRDAIEDIKTLAASATEKATVALGTDAISSSVESALKQLDAKLEGFSAFSKGEAERWHAESERWCSETDTLRAEAKAKQEDVEKWQAQAEAALKSAQQAAHELEEERRKQHEAAAADAAGGKAKGGPAPKKQGRR